MDKEQLKEELMSCLKSTKLSESERISKLKYLQGEVDDLNDILGIDSNRRIQILEEAKKQLKDDSILYPYVIEKQKLDLDENETVKR